jgi:hypothetical protein
LEFIRRELAFFQAICWRQGILRSTRWQFWWQLAQMLYYKPQLFYEYFVTLGIGEHFFTFRYEVKTQLEAQLAELAQGQVTDSTSITYQLLASS